MQSWASRGFFLEVGQGFTHGSEQVEGKRDFGLMSKMI